MISIPETQNKMVTRKHKVVDCQVLLPVLANLAACMIELGHYGKCVELCSTSIETIEGAEYDFDRDKTHQILRR